MKKKNERWIVLLAFVILGLAMASQIKSNMEKNRQNNVDQLKVENLKMLVSDEIASGEELKKAIEDHERKKEEYLLAAGNDNNDELLKSQLSELEKNKMLAGLTDVKGKGISISLNDAMKVLDDNPLDIIIHDADVIKIINELKKAGAQAISINDERLVASSEQVCGGPTIIINKNKYAVPFEIKAIGNPDLLYDAIDKSEIIAVLRQFRIRVEIKKMDEVMIRRFNNNLDRLVSGLEVVKDHVR